MDALKIFFLACLVTFNFWVAIECIDRASTATIFETQFVNALRHNPQKLVAEHFRTKECAERTQRYVLQWNKHPKKMREMLCERSKQPLNQCVVTKQIVDEWILQAYTKCLAEREV